MPWKTKCKDIDLASISETEEGFKEDDCMKWGMGQLNPIPPDWPNKFNWNQQKHTDFETLPDSHTNLLQ